MSWAVPIAGCVLLVLVFVGAFLDTLHREKQVDAVLGHLLMFGESYGREMVGFSRGVLARGTRVYVLLGQLEQESLVHSREETLAPDYVGLPRRLYSLTARGHAEAIRRASELSKAKAQ
jgi:hypothetical protein